MKFKKFIVLVLTLAITLTPLSLFADSAHAETLKKDSLNVNVPESFAPYSNKDNIADNLNENVITPFKMTPGPGGGGISWKYWGSLKYSKKFIAVTKSAISAAILEIVPWTKVRAIGAIVATYYAAYAPNEYVTEKIYRKWSNGVPIKEKTVYYFYTNRARTHLAGKVSRTYSK
ncbi:hypothetical protein NIE88_20760 [Sporolactobacillus shoreicorticis]|uniref:Uncharacterized protein n=1 Tax=Sporolactobacillus shoreicorticis TaxID=1923877 RepID=A0ABW5S6M8_9BACL|nr:hypothetical protein [Sporolactobacillus shoreicorticis]MCO7128180.1 hypothetical protein [Sporolactobacillus shoreicorticis]